MDIEKIVGLSESDVGPTEENVKQKLIVPLLELLGHQRENMEFEYRTRTGGKLDIYIKNVPSDCKVIIDTKNYNENLNDHIEQIREYTFSDNSLLTVIANGTEIRIYSPLRGISFEKSLLYCIKRSSLNEKETWLILEGLLGFNSLQGRAVFGEIMKREHQIRDTIIHEEHLKEEYSSKAEGIDSDIETKEEEIAKLRTEKDSLEKVLNDKILEIWKEIGLPVESNMTIPSTPTVTGGRKFSLA